VRLLLDEMYPPRLAEELRAVGIDVVTVVEVHLNAAPDSDVFTAAIESQRAVLTENVADFTRIAAAHSTSGSHHHGLLIALSSRFSRRASGIGALAAATQAMVDQHVDDRVVYLTPVAADP